MKRSIVRFQLVLLVVALGLILYRALSGEPAPEGTLVLHDLDERGLAVRTLRVTGAEQRFAAEAIGSFATTSEPRLAAYAWLLDRGTRRVVWQMTPGRAQRMRGTLAEVHDTLTLAPGVYDAYFTSVGNGDAGASRPLLGSSDRWRNNASHWRLVLDALGDPALARSERTEPADAAPRVEGKLWSTAPYEGRRRAETTLFVERPARIEVYAVGAFQPTGKPTIRFEPVGGGEPIWTLPVGETEPAGGASSNRVYRGSVSLQPGLYLVVQEPSGGGWGNWSVNPPFDAAAWGLTLSTDGGVTRFAPFETMQPALAIRQPGDDVDRYVTFRVAERTPVYVFGMGEMSGEERRYDYGWIEAQDGARVWEMEYEDSEPAGGASKNRQVGAWVTLEPGTYRLRYRSDDSHGYGDYNATEPDHPERWGIALFTQTAGQLRKEAEGSEDRAVPLPPPPPPPDVDADFSGEPLTVPGSAPGAIPPPPPTEGALVALLRTGNRQSLTESFEVRRTGEFQVYATGEIIGRQRYDYGTLRDSEGRIAWEMTQENTTPAGGSGRNRVFNGTVRLRPGTYTLHYETDGTHAFGDFREGDAPYYPHLWGVVIRPLNE